MDQRISLVTLGVADMDRARAFYLALGWEPAVDLGEVAFYQLGGMGLALWSRSELAADTAVEDPGGWGGITLAHNVSSPDEVDVTIQEARSAGAVVTREPAATPWGGYSGVFTDPDGHPWEVAHNPAWPIADDGTVTISG